jgi:hypothetical protein
MSLAFDSTSDRLERFTNIVSPLGSTMMAWFYFASFGSGVSPLLVLAEQSGEFYSAQVNASSQLELYNGSGGSPEAGSTVSAGNWYHVAMIDDGVNVKVYLGGILDITMDHVGIGPDSMTIGNDSSFGQAFRGRVAALKVYQRALTVDELNLEMGQHELVKSDDINTWLPMVDDNVADCLRDYSAIGGDLALGVSSALTVEDGPPIPWREFEFALTFSTLDASPEFARPDGDVSAGSWTATPLWQKVDEAPADDGDFITSASAPVNDTCELSLTDVPDPGVSTGHILRVHRKKSASSGNQMDMRYRLLQGTTEIASWTDDTNISETAFALAERTLTGGQADAITDYTNLRVEIRANQNTQASAAPTFVAVGAVGNGVGAISVAPPAGLLNNDILLLFIATENQAVATPSGWAIVADSPQSTGTAGNTAATRLSIFWKRTTGSESNATAADPGDSWVGRMMAVRGCVTSGDPWDVTAGGVLSTANTAVSINGDTTTVDNCLIVAAFSHTTDISSTAQVSGWTNASLASITERIDNTVTSGDGGGIGVATGVKVSAGAYNATTATLVTASNQGRISIALKPPAAPSVAAQVSWVEFEVPGVEVAAGDEYPAEFRRRFDTSALLRN